MKSAGIRNFPESHSSNQSNTCVKRGIMGLLQGPFPSPIIPQRTAIDGLKMSAEEPSNGIPLRKFGRHEVKVSALGVGGHHLGDAEKVPEAIRLVQEAM